MQVTTKMVKAAFNKGGFDYRLTNEPLRQQMREAIEAALETLWNRFDVDDKSTWPELDLLVLTNQGLPAAFNDKYTWYLEYYQLDDQNVTHWMPLPELIRN
jgi:hypothetical protein